MDILLINKLYHPHIGGVENHVRTLAKGLVDKARVRVLCANSRAKSIVDYVDGMQVTRLASLYRGLAAPVAPAFLWNLPDDSCDVQHVHFPSGMPEIALALRESTRPIVVTYHSDIVRQRVLEKAFRPFAVGLLEKAARIIVSSPNLVENSVLLPRFKEKCRVIPFGIDRSGFEETEEVAERAESIRGKYGERLVFFLGRLIYYKGIEYLVKAMTEIEGTLLIGGEGPLLAPLKQLAGGLKVDSKVVFLGSVPKEDLPAYYKACDVFVLPSVAPSEAYGLVQIEAHMSGTPVVSTNLPTGVPFVNKDGVTGFVVPPKDERALADKINRLLDDDDLRKGMGERAKARAFAEFTAEIMVERTYELYSEVLDGGRAV